MMQKEMWIKELEDELTRIIDEINESDNKKFLIHINNDISLLHEGKITKHGGIS